MGPDRIHEDVPLFPGTVDPDAVDPNPGMQHGFGPPSGINPKWFRSGLSFPLTPEPHRQLPGAGAQPVGSTDGCRMFDTSDPRYLGLTQRRMSTGIWQPKPMPHHFTLGSPTPELQSPDRQLLGVGTRLEFDRFKDGVPNMTGSGLRNRLPGVTFRIYPGLPKPC